MKVAFLLVKNRPKLFWIDKFLYPNFLSRYKTHAKKFKHIIFPCEIFSIGEFFTRIFSSRWKTRAKFFKLIKSRSPIFSSVYFLLKNFFELIFFKAAVFRVGGPLNNTQTVIFNSMFIFIGNLPCHFHSTPPKESRQPHLSRK